MNARTTIPLKVNIYKQPNKSLEDTVSSKKKWQNLKGQQCIISDKCKTQLCK